MTTYKLKNYATTVPAERSIAEIEKLLAMFGATAIMKEYTSDGRARGMSFKLDERVFRLPANAEGVKGIMFKDRRNYYGRDSMKNRDDQAYRVSWRILKDWIHAQLSLVVSGQAQPDEIFFPYLYDSKRQLTAYQVYSKARLLPEAKKENEDE